MTSEFCVEGEVIAVIPARGGSKGIPGKNIKPLGGKPLIVHTIDAAKAARQVSRVIVSTDDAQIGKLAHDVGAQVIWRPAEIAGDTASSEAALLHVLETLQATEGKLPALMVFLQCTSPFTTSADIDDTIQAMIEQSAQTALAVTPFHYFLWKPDAHGNLVGINHDKSVRPMRQQREKQYLETGSVYVMQVEGFLQHRHRFFGKTAMHVIDADRVLEIDEPEDLLVAEARMAAMRQAGAGTSKN